MKSWKGERRKGDIQKEGKGTSIFSIVPFSRPAALTAWAGDFGREKGTQLSSLDGRNSLRLLCSLQIKGRPIVVTEEPIFLSRNAIARIMAAEPSIHKAAEGERFICYRIADGSVVFSFERGRYGCKFSSMDAVGPIEEMESWGTPLPAAYDFALGEAFPHEIERLRIELAAALGFQQEELDYSFASLGRLELAARAQVPMCQRNESRIVPALIAYTGEVYRRRRSAKWRMDYDQKYEVWLPVIGRDRGETFRPDVIVVREYIYRDDSEGSFTGCVGADLAHWKS